MINQDNALAVKGKKNAMRIILIVTALLLSTALTFSSIFSANAANITKGDTAANVRIVQQRLSDLGYYKAKVDGIWGAKTLAAVKTFQRDYGLIADGIVGSWTEKALKVTLNSGAGTNTGAGGYGGYSAADVNLLARCVYGEARGEPYEGQVAIAAVVLNRVKSSKFPNTVAGVIYQPGAFTAVDDGQINLKPNQTAYNAVYNAINGWDPTYGCLFYYNPATATSKWIWTLTVTLKIGRHNFARG